MTGVAGENARECARWIKLEWNENWRPPIREERGLWSQAYGTGHEGSSQFWLIVKSNHKEGKKHGAPTPQT